LLKVKCGSSSPPATHTTNSFETASEYAEMTVLAIPGYCLLLLFLQGSIVSVSAFVLRSGTANHRNHNNNAATTTEIRTATKNKNVVPVVDLIVIDHYDSFTYNLVDMLTQLCGKPPIVFPSDCAETWAEFLAQQQHRHDDEGGIASYYDGIVLSPGPGHPRDCALGLDIVRRNPHVPILGVCLGHQIIGLAYNATVDRAPQPVHGQIQRNIEILKTTSSTVKDEQGEHRHDGEEATSLFEGIDDLSVTRYHSLQVILPASDDDATSSVLRPTAVARDDNVLMAFRHDNRPHWGVQFHPESIGTSHGMELLANFVAECAKKKLDPPLRRSPTSRLWPQTTSSIAAAPDSQQQRQQQPTPVTAAAATAMVWIHRVPSLPLNGGNMKPVHVMDDLLAADPFTYWLDHSDTTRLPGISILGSCDIINGQRVEYYGRDKNVTSLKVVDYVEGMERTRVSNETIVSFLEGQIPESIKVLQVDFSGDGHRTSNIDVTTLPFDFLGGFVGYLGYEVRLDLTRPNKSTGPMNRSTRSDDENVPTAAFVRADRSFVYCHKTCQWYLVGTFQDNDVSRDDVEEWMVRMSRRLQLGIMRQAATKAKAKRRSRTMVPQFLPRRSPKVYAENFDRCLHHIRQGDSYELCLTNQLETVVDASLDPLELHKILRTKNPAPYSAFMSWAGRFAISSSSPERFLSVKRRASGDLVVEAKPIKGTIARVLAKNGIQRTEQEDLLDRQRATDLQDSVKDRAENLMIVDLLRNDLSRVCRPGTVHVSKLMGIESYATVHQMVSTIRGSLDNGRSSSLSSKKSATVDVLRSCFPGGSMTGAPKVRSMEILNELEEGAARGPYSGCMGYLSLNGAMDMNIIIRTAVLSHDNNKNGDDGTGNWKVRIGAGGAITALSDRQSEFDELMLKADVVVRSVQEWAGGSAQGVVVAEERAVQASRLTNSTETL
jgi:para-aminobenzoate synthetase